MKICSKCNVEKEDSEFYKNGNKLTSYCKVCNKAKVKEWRKTEVGKEKWKDYRNDKVKRVKEWVNEQKTLGCERCGDTRFYVIDFHHKDPSTKKFSIGSGYANSNFKMTKEEIAKCTRLCANCHRELHYLENL